MQEQIYAKVCTFAEKTEFLTDAVWWWLEYPEAEILWQCWIS